MTIKTLGPVSANLITTLAKSGKKIFGVADAKKITNLTVNATTDLLSELVKRKVIARLKPGKYLILPLETTEYMENWYVVARELIQPHPYYISHYSAMDIHNMVTQAIQVIYITTPIRRQNRKVGGAKFRFIYTASKNLWGIKEEWVTPQERVQVSDLERTIVDCLYNPSLCGGISEIAKGIWIVKHTIDYEKLVGYIKKFGKKVVGKRLGFILETYEVDKSIEFLTNFIKDSKSYALLDPTLPNQGKYYKRWRLRINIEPRELKTIIKT